MFFLPLQTTRLVFLLIVFHQTMFFHDYDLRQYLFLRFDHERPRRRYPNPDASSRRDGEEVALIQVS